MAATNYFLGIPVRDVVTDDMTNSNITFGSATTATDYVELRIMTVKADGTTATNITKLDVFRALEVFKRWILEGGQTTGNDSGLPIL